MRGRLTAAVATIAVAIAYPAAALAQSAGDNQYTDPLAGKHATPPSHSSTSSSPTTPAPSSSQVAPAQSSSTTSAGTAPSSSTAASSVPLANTGFDAWIPALGGALLIAAAVALRRSLRGERA